MSTHVRFSNNMRETYICFIVLALALLIACCCFLGLHELTYGKCSKIFNTICLAKRPRQAVPCLLFRQAFCEFQPR